MGSEGQREQEVEPAAVWCCGRWHPSGMEARISELRTQLRDGREALDAFVREHGQTGDYELFAAAVQSLEQKLHEVEARVVTADDQKSSKGAQMQLPHDSTPPTSPPTGCRSCATR